ncbi:MAG: helix-turn-helix transcriptional regulator [Croceitalea sp.]|nr:AraC family transcriptional regulator [Croceitalea sp.]MBT8239053.1 AraC family transcriptional regulator [Croceitalea sp.]NNC35784.1 helix-turn-helix transcriptional regulator [Croceitalea sp.]NNL09773.1 helix-turn-helix transcriptional regulator [Croceitalea sp.]NNM17772.1 helix-turn-helix transcriptional regulator [Croceitalea sp.]
MLKKYKREITNLSDQDSFLVIDRIRDTFDYPIHFHPDLELNFIVDGKGMQRTVGFNIEEIDDFELVLVGSNVYHGWKMHNCNNSVHEVTIQFHNDLFEGNLTRKSIMKPFREMLEKSVHGILFQKEEAIKMAPRLTQVSKLEGIAYFLELFSILYDLSITPNQRLLSITQTSRDDFDNSDRVKIFYNFIQENYANKITLDQVSALLNMSKVSFNRFIKKSTERTFVEYLNDVRVQNASRLLAEEDDGISEIAYKCGFYNIANFNRIFKKAKGCTPSQYRKEFQRMTRVQ